MKKAEEHEAISIGKGDRCMSAGEKTMACYVAVLSACILFLGWLLAGHYRADDKFGFYNTSELAVELQEEGSAQIYGCVLPAVFEDSQNLLFKSTHAVVEVLLDDTVIYTYGIEKQLPGKSPGTYWHIVLIPAESDGRELAIRLTSSYGSGYELDIGVRYGGRGDCILALVGSFLPILILNSITIVMGLICLLLFIRGVRKGEKDTGFLCIGLFSVTIAIWSLRQCGFLQFLIPNGEILYFVDIHMLFLVMAPLNMFIYFMSRTKWKKSFLWITLAYLVGVMIGTILQFTGIMDLFELLTGLHILIAVNGVYMLWAIHREGREHKSGIVRRLRVPLYTLIVFGVLELVTYYVPIFGAMSIFLPLGATVFILMLIWQQVEQHYEGVLEEQKLLYYEKIANTDMLTGAFSRNAYENMLKQLAEDKNGLRAYGAVLFDVNDLKIINDSYGHECGDEAIKRCYDLIVTTFGDKGNCYRIGGDEFVFLALDEMDMEQQISCFNASVARIGEGLDFPFNVALGYAVFDAARDSDVRDTIKRSDAMMYLDKKKKKQTRRSGKGRVNPVFL